MKSFLKSADKRTYIFDLKEYCEQEIVLSSGTTRLVDTHTLEVEVNGEVVLNEIFSELTSKYGLEVLDVRSKAAKLEQLFIDVARNK